VVELEHSSNDLSNLLASTDQPTLFLDTEFRINWFTPPPRASSACCAPTSGARSRHRQKFADPEPAAGCAAGPADAGSVGPGGERSRERVLLRRDTALQDVDNQIKGVVVLLTT